MKVSATRLKGALGFCVNNLNEYSKDNFKTLVRVAGVSKDYERANEIIMFSYLMAQKAISFY